MKKDTLILAYNLYKEIEGLKETINALKNDTGLHMEFYCHLPLTYKKKITNNEYSDIYYFVKKTLLKRLKKDLEQKEKEFEEL